MLHIWMKLMVLMLLMMNSFTILTMMMILVIRPGEGGAFCSTEGPSPCFQEVSNRFFVVVAPALMVAKPKVDHLLKRIVYSILDRMLRNADLFGEDVFF